MKHLIRYLSAFILFILILLNFTHLIYLNIYTHSLPQGIYFRIKGSPKVGDFAATCLTEPIARYGIERNYLAQGHCPTGTVYVLKVIVGLPGDRFDVKDGFFRINKHSYRIMTNDSIQRPLKLFYRQKEGIIDKANYILLSDHVRNSWDSRYWGPVSIEFLLKPLWLIENVRKFQISHP